MAITTARPFRAAALALTSVAAACALAIGGAGAAQAVGYQGEIRFAPGASSAVVDGAIVRGDADHYYLEARRGQVMTVSTWALEGNVNFSVSGPDGPTLVVADHSTDITLPRDGYYRVTVAPTRGNATYTLYVEIR
ncbi:hypothetical protein [Nocardia bovistercoris]|uniref:Uncharacterized protein n=1 Tax=Nocardia bovistercoris TaxID=2785916 RepID=A0A931I772_9NOCA|nr:hypothetical protein [Nocardia bovistercoris]MBH0775321.1 hypothetical protein [Nocardia bovistercoris]